MEEISKRDESDQSPPPTTARRAATRKLLIDAAYSVCAESGFGKSTVEQICDRAGFTRGAFYSNFTSLDDLYFDMWSVRSQSMIAEMAEAFDSNVWDTAFTLHSAVEAFIAAVPLDADWFRINAEFSARASRDPELRQAVADRETAVVAGFMPIIERVLDRIGLRILGSPDDLGFALVAANDGMTVQCVLFADREAALNRRKRLIENVIRSWTEPVSA